MSFGDLPPEKFRALLERYSEDIQGAAPTTAGMLHLISSRSAASQAQGKAHLTVEDMVMEFAQLCSFLEVRLAEIEEKFDRPATNN